MFAVAKEEGIDLILFAGFRNEQTQRFFYERAGNGDNMSVAPPRSSEHETGYAADILAVGSMTRDSAFGKTKAGTWLQKNAPQYGFILRYLENKTNITGYFYEPWHFRYLGRELAYKVTETGLCYEEFLQLYPEQKVPPNN